MSQQSVNYPQALEEAFHTFNRLSGQLTNSYHALESRVASLNEELAHAHDQRYKELTEKERLANRLSTLLTALPGGIVVLDQNGHVQEHNPVAADLLGEPLQGVSWQEVISRAFSLRVDDGHDISLIDGRRVNISTCPLGTEPGQILLITDVTEVRKLQDRLTQNQRLAAMGEMAASLAHQIRTPLSSAILYSSNLKRQQLTELERHHTGEKIMSRLRHLEHVVNDMLLYARGASPGGDEFSVEDLLAELVVSLDSQLQTTEINFTVINEDGHAGLMGNRQMILSALINLVVNAIQALQGEGCIEVIGACMNETTLQIIVKDNGVGFSPEARANAFEPFYTTRNEGTGLGLAVVAAIVSAHGGDISLQSEEGKGSTFTLLLPIVQHADKYTAEQNLNIRTGMTA